MINENAETNRCNCVTLLDTFLWKENVVTFWGLDFECLRQSVSSKGIEGAASSILRYNMPLSILLMKYRAASAAPSVPKRTPAPSCTSRLSVSSTAINLMPPHFFRFFFAHCSKVDKPSSEARLALLQIRSVKS